MSQENDYGSFERELYQDFIAESLEGLEVYDRELLRIEEGAADEGCLNTVFRVVHTVKGTAGCLGLGKIEATSHAGENLLSLLREGQLSVSSDLVTGLLRLGDALREMVRSLEEGGDEGSGDYSEIVSLLTKLQTAVDLGETTSASYGLFDEEPDVLETEIEMSPRSVPQHSEISDLEPVRGLAEDASSQAIRVSIGQLDKVMNLVGELVLARNQIVSSSQAWDPAAILKASQRLNSITSELQESVMKTRMLPIDKVLSRFPRVVRDVAAELGKEVRVVLEGRGTELDRSLLEAIRDPLTHLVRNAVDHGIEALETRRRLGKPEVALVTIKAYHEGGQVIVEVSDDGAGIDAERLKSKALQKGLITEVQAEALAEKEALQLIFLPGFSTAEKITTVSGRGVGMDVVKTNIHRIGGTVDLNTKIGVGTTIKIRIPLTLAIIPGLLVDSGGERFVIPQVSLLELIRLEDGDGHGEIEDLIGVSVYRLRGELLPIIYLDEILGLASAGESPSRTRGADHVVNVVVLEADCQPYGLVVSNIYDTEEIVVKPLGRQLKSLSCYAGATIMGDGKVALILDAMGLAERSCVFSQKHGDLVHGVGGQDSKSKGGRCDTLLLFQVGQRGRFGMPMSRANRLEEVGMDRVECSSDGAVCQYRGGILPLIDVGRQLGIEAIEQTDTSKTTLQVIVVEDSGRLFGLVVDRILDIVAEDYTLEPSEGARPMFGSAIVQGQVTDLLDVKRLLAQRDRLKVALSANNSI